jgi:hypothetical protein
MDKQVNVYHSNCIFEDVFPYEIRKEVLICISWKNEPVYNPSNNVQSASYTPNTGKEASLKKKYKSLSSNPSTPKK